jgi:hypothetical protein
MKKVVAVFLFALAVCFMADEAKSDVSYDQCGTDSAGVRYCCTNHGVCYPVEQD